MMVHWTTAVLFCATVALAALVTLLARVSARHLGVLDRPGEAHKQHRGEVPLLGGMAVCTTFVAVVGICTMLDGLQGQDDLQLLPVLASLAIFCICGLLDDLKPQRARTKLTLQILAALPWVCAGLPFESLRLFGEEFYLGPAAPVLAVFWILCCVNAMNLIDGLDGLAALTGAAILSGIAGIAVFHGDSVTFATSTLLAATLAGFLIHNSPPARIYLGDSGSMAIGFLLGAMTLSVNSPLGTASVSVIPALVLMSIPGFDVLVAIVRRSLTEQSIGEADWNHFHHRLLRNGYSRWRAALTISAFAFVTSCVAMAGIIMQNDVVSLCLCLATLSAITLSVGFGRNELTLLVQLVGRRTLRIGTRAGRASRDVGSPTPLQGESDLTAEPDILPLVEPDSPEEDAGDSGRRAA
jgi:UDP-GlcNAc:undecaprenyl-phosphate GlcNAc-1-phosphate transferase